MIFKRRKAFSLIELLIWFSISVGVLKIAFEFKKDMNEKMEFIQITQKIITNQPYKNSNYNLEIKENGIEVSFLNHSDNKKKALAQHLRKLGYLVEETGGIIKIENIQ